LNHFPARTIGRPTRASSATKRMEPTNGDRRTTMGILAIGAGAVCCAGGAVAHFIDTSRHREGLFGLAGFCFLLTGLFLSR
ncbi:hypothetical protein, partial [Escherichia coli]